MENKSISGQKGICAVTAYLVMRNECSRQSEKTESEVEGKEREGMGNCLSQLEEGKKRVRVRENKLEDSKENITNKEFFCFALLSQ